MKKKIIKKSNMKKAIIVMLTFMLITASACSPTKSTDNTDNAVGADIEKMTIICAGFAEYDWTANILGSNPANFDLVLLNDSGLDMHSYQPSVADMVALSKANLLIFTGGDSENWLKEAVLSSGKSEECIYQISEIFTHTPALIGSYSLECEGEHNHEDNKHHHEHKFDEHLWLSLKMAPTFINGIAQKLASIDKANADIYLSNAANYISAIDKLDRDFENTLKIKTSSRKNTLLFADRFPFKYLLEDYNIEHIAAFPGCSAETEASFSTIVDLTETMKKLELSSVVVLKKSKTDLAETIISGANCSNPKILTLDSMQSVTSKDIKNGLTYLGAMKSNLQVISAALIAD